MSTENKVLIYLWGIETRHILFSKQLDKRVLIYLWGIETSDDNRDKPIPI